MDSNGLFLSFKNLHPLIAKVIRYEWKNIYFPLLVNKLINILKLSEKYCT